MENSVQPEKSSTADTSTTPAHQEPPRIAQPSHKLDADKWYRVRNRSKENILSKKGFTIISAESDRSMAGKEILQKFDLKDLEELEGSEKIFIRELECNPPDVLVLETREVDPVSLVRFNHVLLTQGAVAQFEEMLG